MAVASFIGCNMPSNQTFYSEPLVLRQMVNTQTTHSSISGGYFMFMGGFSGGSYEVNQLKVFAKVGDYYRFINIPLRNLAIKLDNNVTTPYIVISYYNDVDNYSDEELVSDRYAPKKKYYLTCPDIYLPEELLEINITQPNN